VEEVYYDNMPEVEAEKELRLGSVSKKNFDKLAVAIFVMALVINLFEDLYF
jgi:hypothetical protein